MAADRFSFALAWLCLGAAATATAATTAAATSSAAATAAGISAAEHSQPFTVQDLVRLERVSELAASPDGGRVAYVREHNLYVEDLADGRITQLTHDGSRTIINGTFDWVYEEELNLRDGFRWSPDGRRIAFWQLDASGVRDFDLINDTDSLYSFVVPVQYPKAGTTNSAARVGVVSADESVDVRKVQVGDRVGSLWIIAQGLKPGERVIVEGLDKVKAGEKVKAMPADPEPAAPMGRSTPAAAPPTPAAPAPQSTAPPARSPRK